jgi:formate dehydrogenase subunit delta
MSDQDLTRMANQIADFFASYPPDEAVPGVADHIVKFWPPDMRQAFLAEIAAGGNGLSPLALEAGQRLASEAKARTNETEAHS